MITITGCSDTKLCLNCSEGEKDLCVAMLPGPSKTRYRVEGELVFYEGKKQTLVEFSAIVESADRCQDVVKRFFSDKIENSDRFEERYTSYYRIDEYGEPAL